MLGKRGVTQSMVEKNIFSGYSIGAHDSVVVIFSLRTTHSLWEEKVGLMFVL